MFGFSIFSIIFITIGVVLVFLFIWAVFFAETAPTKRVTKGLEKISGKENIENLFKKIGVKYSEELSFPELFSSYGKMDIRYYALLNSLSGEVLKKAESNEKANVYIKWVDRDVGYGVFADENIKKGDFIMKYGGVVMRHPFSFLLKFGIKYITSEYSYEDPHVIRCCRVGNEARFINDNPQKPESINIERRFIFIPVSEDKNIGYFALVFCALKDIMKDEQLLIEYDYGHWDFNDAKLI